MRRAEKRHLREIRMR